MKQKESVATIDRDVPDVIDDLARAGSWAMANIDPVRELTAFEAAVELQKKLITASIRATKPQDWVEMGGHAYLQATGIERVAPLWGLFFGEPEVTRQEEADGEYHFIVRGPAGSRRTGVFYQGIEGGRSSSDQFFDEFTEPKPNDFASLPGGDQRAWRRAHRIPPSELDVRKAAITNWQTRAASMLAGLRGLTMEDLKAAGISEGVRRVEYGAGGKGGDARPADLKAAATALGNDVLAAVGGVQADSKKLLKEITAGKGFAGFDSVTGIKHQWQIDNARAKLDAHPIFGKKQPREPGDEQEGR
jgi:hypothetical protein